MTIEQNKELRPCPFCGMELIRVEYDDIRGNRHVAFDHPYNHHCMTASQLRILADDYEKIKDWNTRHPDPQFFSEIKKRCMEECEKEKMPETPVGTHLIYNLGCEACKQAIHQMEIE